MKAIITKYALTQGPYIVEGEISDEFPQLFTVTKPCWQTYHGKGKEWHITQDSARARVVAMINGRRKSLEKSLSELNARAEEALKAVEVMKISS